MTQYTYYAGDGLGNYDVYYRVANDGALVEHALADSPRWFPSAWAEDGWDLDDFLDGRRPIPELDVPVTLLTLKDTAQ